MRFAQRRNRLTTHLSERIPVVRRRISVWPSLSNEQILLMILGLCTKVGTLILATIYLQLIQN